MLPWFGSAHREPANHSSPGEDKRTDWLILSWTTVCQDPRILTRKLLKALLMSLQIRFECRTSQMLSFPQITVRSQMVRSRDQSQPDRRSRSQSPIAAFGRRRHVTSPIRSQFSDRTDRTDRSPIARSEVRSQSPKIRSQPIAVRSQPIALDSPGCQKTRSARLLIFSLNHVFEILRSQKSAITDRRWPPIARSPIAPIADHSRTRNQQKLSKNILTQNISKGLESNNRIPTKKSATTHVHGSWTLIRWYRAGVPCEVSKKYRARL